MRPDRRALLAGVVGVLVPGRGRGAFDPATSDPLSVRSHGARFDGTARKVVDVHGSLSDVRKAFPLLPGIEGDVELDFAALCHTVELASRRGGGRVDLPSGDGVMNNAVRRDACVVIPEARPFGTRGVQVNIVGQGDLATTLSWRHDAGRGRFGLSCGDPAATPGNRKGRYAPDGFYHGLCAGFGIRGPSGSTAKGEAPAGMDGFAWGSRRAMRGVRSTGFRSGFSVVGDHARWEGCSTRENLHGVCWDRPNADLYGDLVFSDCKFAGDNLAALAVHGDASVSARFVDRCYLGAPYSVLRLAGGPGQRIWMADTVFDGTMFEYVGNGFVREDDQVPSGWLQRVRFLNSFFSFRDGAGWTVPGRRRVACFDVGRFWDVEFDGCGWHGLDLRGCDGGVFRLADLDGLAVKGDVDALLKACADAGRPILDGSLPPSAAARTVLVNRGGESVWRGSLRRNVSGETLRRRTVVGFAAGGVAPAIRGSRVAGVCLADTPVHGLVPYASGGVGIATTASPGLSPGDAVALSTKGAVGPVRQGDVVLGVVDSLRQGEAGLTLTGLD